MKVHIEDNLYIESDSHNFMVNQYTGGTDKVGRPIYKTLGYFSTLEGCVQFLLTMKLKQSTAASLAELRRDVLSIREYIRSQLGV